MKRGGGWKVKGQCERKKGRRAKTESKLELKEIRKRERMNIEHRQKQRQNGDGEES